MDGSKIKHDKENKEPKRSQLDKTFDQYYCTWESSKRRAEKLISDMYLENKKILFIGDDDLTSIAISCLSNSEIHVFEIDDKLVNNITEISEDEKLNINVHQCDITKGIHSPFKNYFDVNDQVN